MRIRIYQLALAITFFLAGPHLWAQAMPSATIGNVHQSGQTIEFEITASENFYVGANNFVLYIGNNTFDLNRQENTEGKGKLTFLIPLADYTALKEGDKIYLSYGDRLSGTITDQERQALCEAASNLSRAIGVFTNKLLTK